MTMHAIPDGGHATPDDGAAIAVTGANGAVGLALLARIAGGDGPRAVALVRRRAAQDALPQSPRITPRVIDYRDADALAAALAGVESVVHLAGILAARRAADYRIVHVEATRALVDAAHRAGVRRLVLVSAIGADPRSPNLYWRTKGEAERIAAGAGLDAAIIRTPLLLGPATAGGRALLRDAARPAVRLPGGGAHLVRPLDVDDLCDAILGCCRRRADGAQTYDLVGPTALRYRELLQQVAHAAGRTVTVRSTPVRLLRAGARLLQRLRVGGPAPAMIDVITADETIDRNADGDLGIRLTPLTDTLAKLRPAA